MTSRWPAKAAVVALSLASTLGGWAAFATGARPEAPAVSAAVPDLPPIPGIAHAPEAGRFALDLPPIPPIARTRSSR